MGGYAVSGHRANARGQIALLQQVMPHQAMLRRAVKIINNAEQLQWKRQGRIGDAQSSRRRETLTVRIVMSKGRPLLDLHCLADLMQANLINMKRLRLTEMAKVHQKATARNGSARCTPSLCANQPFRHANG